MANAIDLTIGCFTSLFLYINDYGETATEENNL